MKESLVVQHGSQLLRGKLSALLIVGVLGLNVGCSDDPKSEDSILKEDMGVELDASSETRVDLDVSRDASLTPQDLGESPEMSMSALDMAERKEDVGVQGEDMHKTDASSPEGDRVPLFVATGRMGRSLMSCDGGETWQGDRDLATEGDAHYCDEVQPDAVCKTTACKMVTKSGVCKAYDECACSDHQPGSPRGIAWGDGWFVALYGWGSPGVIMRSQDGLVWEKVQRGGGMPNVMYGAGRFVLGAQFTMSEDQGKTWTPYRERLRGTGIISTVHHVASTGIYIMVGRDGTLRSEDDGKTWEMVEDWPQGCDGNFSKGMVSHGNKVLYFTGQDPQVCVSGDGGKTWRNESSVPEEMRGGRPIHDGEVFHTWTNSSHNMSKDGLTWKREALVGVSRQQVIRGIAYDPVNKRFVGVSKSAYDKQVIYYSDDGTTWQRVKEGSMPKGHELRHVAFGWSPPGFVCPSK